MCFHSTFTVKQKFRKSQRMYVSLAGDKTGSGLVEEITPT